LARTKNKIETNGAGPVTDAPSRPRAPVVPTADKLPPELVALPRWLCWVYDWRGGPDWAKQPYDPLTGKWKGWQKSTTTLEQARKGAAEFRGDGVGFKPEPDDPYIFVDFDDCLRDGVVDPVVAMWLKFFPTYREISPSGGGLRVVVKGRLPQTITNTKLPNSEMGSSVELYDGNSGRYVTITGNHLGEPRFEIREEQISIDKLLKSIGFVSKPTSGSEDDDHPLTVEHVRKIYARHLDEFRAMKSASDSQNDKLNTCALLAARGFLAGAFEKDEEELRSELRDIAVSSGHCAGIERTLDSGWDSGVKKGPFVIVEDKYPEATATLKEFNEKYFIVKDLGGKCRVCREHINADTGNLELVHREFDEFKKAYMHKRIVVDSETRTVGRGKSAEVIEVPVYKDKATFWLNDEYRREFERVAFAPNETLPPDVRNMWRGFRVEPKAGKIPRFLEHVFENICRANQARYDWYMRWQSWKVRNPGRQPGTCPVLIGPEGVGKNIAADPLPFIFGPHSFVATKPEHVTGHFNSHMRACCFLLGNEALYAGSKRDGSVLKSLITDDLLSIEGKGLDTRMERNRMAVMLATNEPWAVLAGVSARRFSVFAVGEKHIQDHDYFNRIALELGGTRGGLSGYSALLHHLLYEIELKDFQPQKIILTEALAGQQAQSLRGADALWHAILFRGEMPGGLPGNLLRTERLLKWAQLQHDKKYEGITDRQLGQLLGENTVGEARGMGFKHLRPRPMIDGHRVRAWVIPNLRECRRHWDELRFVESWPELEPYQLSTNPEERDPDDWTLVPVGDERPVQRSVTA
jgi:hypothetical protein